MNGKVILTLEQLDSTLPAGSAARPVLSLGAQHVAAGDYHQAFQSYLQALRVIAAEFGSDHPYCVPVKIALARADVKQWVGCERTGGRYASYARQLLEEVAAVLPQPFREIVELTAQSNYDVGIAYGASDRG